MVERRGRDILTLSHVALTSGIGVDELIHVPILNAYLSPPNCALKLYDSYIHTF